MKTIIVALALIIGTTGAAIAQTKVAHIEAQVLVESMPEYKAAISSLEKIERSYDTEIKAMMKELETKMRQYDSEAASKTEQENMKRVEEVQEMQGNIQAYRQQALADIEKKQMDIMKPILEKARAAIQKVGKAQGFQYVFDSSIGSGILMAEGKDLMNDVKKELGI
ncbi:MAG TPA: OmpH family outer membrane protein [Flavobacteriaceae bacterium]|nr:OmpH family outer membrane protein [Flavobacteriaceae bacterium]